MDSPTLTTQLDEFQLIRCSLLPGELFSFIEDSQNHHLWTNLLETHTMGTPVPVQDIDNLSTAHIQIHIEAAKLRISIQVPTSYAGNLVDVPPTFSIKGDQITRLEQEQWQAIIEEKLRETDQDTEYVFFHSSACLHKTFCTPLIQIPNIPTHLASPAPAPPLRIQSS